MNTHSFSHPTRGFIDAVVNNDLSAAAELLREHPGIVQDRNTSKETPLHWLAVENLLEGVRLLIEHGADVNAKDRSGRSILMDAAGLGLCEVCSLLLKNGADPKYQHWHDKETALHVAARHGPAGDVIDILITAGAEVDVLDHMERTPLSSAAGFGNIEAARKLLAHGADPNGKGSEDHSPLQEMGEEASVELIELLLSRGARLDATARERLGRVGNKTVRQWISSHPIQSPK